MRPLRVLVSGGTGFLGLPLVEQLAKHAELTLLSRSRPDCLPVDLCRWHGGIDIQLLRDRFDVFLHVAGLYNLRAGQVEAYKQNIFGTHTALMLAEKARIPHFVHVSTVAVLVGEEGEAIPPAHLRASREFPDHYASSKAQAELLVRSWRADAFESRTILRPGILVGDTASGHIFRIDGPYHAFNAVRALKPVLARWPGAIPLPGAPDRSIPVVPVDACADAIARIVVHGRAHDWKGTKSFHLAPRRELRLTAQRLFREALDRYGLHAKPIAFLGDVPKAFSKPVAEWVANLPREEIEYLLALPEMDVSATEAILGDDWCPPFDAYKDAFFHGYETYLQNS